MASGARKKPYTRKSKDPSRKIEEVREVQVRMDDGELRFFQNISDAWAFFLKMKTAWKISWTFPKRIGGKRLRIVKLMDRAGHHILQADYMEDIIAQFELGHSVYVD